MLKSLVQSLQRLVGLGKNTEKQADLELQPSETANPLQNTAENSQTLPDPANLQEQLVQQAQQTPSKPEKITNPNQTQTSQGMSQNQQPFSNKNTAPIADLKPIISGHPFTD